MCACFFLFFRVFWNLEILSVLENTIQNILSIRYFCVQKRPRFSHRTFFVLLKNIVFCFHYSVRHLFIYSLFVICVFVCRLCSFIIWICDRDHFDLKCTFSSESKKHVSQQRFSWKLKTFIKHVICLWSRSEKKSEILNVFTIDIQQQQWNHHKNSVKKQKSKKTKPIKSDQFVRRKDEISNENQIGLKNKMTATNGHCCKFAYVKIHWSPFIQHWLYFHRWFSSNQHLFLHYICIVFSSNCSDAAFFFNVWSWIQTFHKFMFISLREHYRWLEMMSLCIARKHTHYKIK